MDEERELLRRLASYHAVLRLITDSESIAALKERIGQTLSRLEQIKGIRHRPTPL
jgi:hypothetical protein